MTSGASPFKAEADEQTIDLVKSDIFIILSEAFKELFTPGDGISCSPQ
jgi:hypothetical protein